MSDVLNIEADLTDLAKGKIVTRMLNNFNLNKTLYYVKVTTADNKVHTIYV
jgi:hypothetical protein